MSNWENAPLIIIIVFTLFLCWCCMKGFQEHFARHEDTSNRDRTDKLANSSYAQTTNHALPQSKFNAPVHGIESPFRVNLFQAHL